VSSLVEAQAPKTVGKLVEVVGRIDLDDPDASQVEGLIGWRDVEVALAHVVLLHPAQGVGELLSPD
jgi:hypothetical protein